MANSSQSAEPTQAPSAQLGSVLTTNRSLQLAEMASLSSGTSSCDLDYEDLTLALIEFLKLYHLCPINI